VRDHSLSKRALSHAPSLLLEIDIDPWPGPMLTGKRWPTGRLRLLRGCAGDLQPAPACASLLFADDAEVHALNREWRARTSRPTCCPFRCWSAPTLLVAAADQARPKCWATSPCAWKPARERLRKKACPLEPPRRAPDRPRTAASGRLRPRRPAMPRPRRNGSAGNKGTCADGHRRPIWRSKIRQQGACERLWPRAMADGESRSGDRTVALAVACHPRLLRGGDGDQSLRAQLEEVIDEHEGDAAFRERRKGDLSRSNARCCATCCISANTTPTT
jgi:hypothetical protein